MLQPRPIAAALAALSLAAAGQAVADVQHLNWIEVQSLSAAALPAPAAQSDIAAPGAGEPVGLLVPAVQKVREAAARMSSELTAEERAAYVGGNQSIAIAGARSESVKAGPLTPLDDTRPKAAPAPTPAPYLELKLYDTMISSYSIGSGGAKPPMPAGTGQFSTSPASTRMFNAFANFSDIKGETPSGAGVRALPVQQLPAPSAPQRSPIAAGTSNTPMIGDRLLRPAAAAPVVRR
ncbi:MAG: hypothetical protein ACM36B_07340 [Bacteroidota bacterium]|jgi:hypothetical protein